MFAQSIDQELWPRPKIGEFYMVRYGLAVSSLWILLVVALLIWRSEQIGSLPVNQLGDLVTGVCAPLAFIWLTIAVFLQQRQLENQRQELQQNTKALELQAAELKNSVAQLKTQTELMKENVRLLSDRQRKEILDLEYLTLGRQFRETIRLVSAPQQIVTAEGTMFSNGFDIDRISECQNERNMAAVFDGFNEKIKQLRIEHDPTLGGFRRAYSGQWPEFLERARSYVALFNRLQNSAQSYGADYYMEILKRDGATTAYSIFADLISPDKWIDR